jgi:hypothetical protein
MSGTVPRDAKVVPLSRILVSLRIVNNKES